MSRAIDLPVNDRDTVRWIKTGKRRARVSGRVKTKRRAKRDTAQKPKVLP